MGLLCFLHNGFLDELQRVSAVTTTKRIRNSFANDIFLARCLGKRPFLVLALAESLPALGLISFRRMVRFPYGIGICRGYLA